MSKNFAKSGNGGKVLCATCFDPEHPVGNVLDDDLSTFWPTTGMHVRTHVSPADGGVHDR